AGGTQLAAYKVADGSTNWQLDGLPLLSQSTPALGDGLLFLTLTNAIGDPDENIVKLPSFDEMLKKYDKNGDGKLSRDEIPEGLVLFSRGRTDKVGDWAKVRDAVDRYDSNKDGALDRQEWQKMLAGVTSMPANMPIAVVAVRLEGQGADTK